MCQRSGSTSELPGEGRDPGSKHSAIGCVGIGRCRRELRSQRVRLGFPSLREETRGTSRRAHEDVDVSSRLRRELGRGLGSWAGI